MQIKIQTQLATLTATRRSLLRFFVLPSLSFLSLFVLGGSRHDVWPQNQALFSLQRSKNERGIDNSHKGLFAPFPLLWSKKFFRKTIIARKKKPFFTIALQLYLGDRHGMSIQCLPTFFFIKRGVVSGLPTFFQKRFILNEITSFHRKLHMNLRYTPSPIGQNVKVG